MAAPRLMEPAVWALPIASPLAPVPPMVMALLTSGLDRLVQFVPSGDVMTRFEAPVLATATN